MAQRLPCLDPNNINGQENPHEPVPQDKLPVLQYDGCGEPRHEQHRAASLHEDPNAWPLEQAMAQPSGVHPKAQPMRFRAIPQPAPKRACSPFLAHRRRRQAMPIRGYHDLKDRPQAVLGPHNEPRTARLPLPPRDGRQPHANAHKRWQDWLTDSPLTLEMTPAARQVFHHDQPGMLSSPHRRAINLPCI